MKDDYMHIFEGVLRSISPSFTVSRYVFGRMNILLYTSALDLVKFLYVIKFAKLQEFKFCEQYVLIFLNIEILLLQIRNVKEYSCFYMW